jgi:hypothetical protein
MTRKELIELVQQLCPATQMSADEFLLSASDLQCLLAAAMRKAPEAPARRRALGGLGQSMAH